MKSIHKILTVIAALGTFFSACEKDIATYKNDPRIYFFERNADLNQSRVTFKSYSFLKLPLEVTMDTFYIKVKIMGEPAPYDRIVRGQTITEGTTAKEGEHYTFIDGIVPADSIIGYLPVVLNRTEDIRDSSLTLNLSIAETKDFKPGVTEDDAFTLSWSDNVVKPANWDGLISLSYYFGSYSTVKWRFIISVTGVDNFPLQQSGRYPPLPGEYTNAGMNDIKAMVKDALAAYNSTNDPDLTDEFGQPVTFP